MKRIAFVVVWIGKLPDYYKIWLASCGYNPTVDFFVFTDDAEEYKVPSNVHVHRMNFGEVRSRLAAVFPFPICLGRPYKLCDYKPAFGEAFADFLEGYDYWGYCDIDLIWGDIRSFLTDRVLGQNERLFTRGHCSLFQNNKAVNAYYRTLPALGCLSYQKVYQSEEIWCFDEWGEHCGGGISVIFKKNGINTFDEPLMADIYVGSGDFRINRRPELGRVKGFCFERGTLYAYGEKNGSGREKLLYCHFQKRKVTIADGLKTDCFFLLPPGEITNDGLKGGRLRRRILIMRADLICMLKKVWSGIRRRKREVGNEKNT